MPFVERQISVNITEQMTEAMEQEIITQDNLNAKVDAQVYFKVRAEEQAVKASLYNVYSYHDQIVALAQTSLRNVIGGKDFKEVNSKRNDLNKEIQNLIQVQTEKWGIEVVRVELKQIEPPKDVQITMNKVIQAANEKQANIDYATAAETKADGEQRANVKNATGIKQSAILEAEGRAQAIRTLAEANAMQIETIAKANANQIEVIAQADAKRIELVNTAGQTYFKGNAMALKQYEVTQASLENNSKIVITKEGINPVIVLGDQKVIPIKSD